jgi:carboxypeptidase T
MKWSAVALLLVSSSPAQEPVYREIRLSGAGVPAEVLAPFDHVSRTADGLLVAVATDDDLARLEAAGISYEVVVPDLKKRYRDRFASTLGIGATPPFGFGSMGGYYTFAEVEAKLDLLAAQWPNLVSPKVSIGSSLEGRPLWVIKVSDNPGIDEGEPEVWFDSLHHAREPEGMMALFHFLAWLLQNHGVDPLATHLVDEREIYFLPVVNPDGYVWNETTDPAGGGMWRKNRRPNGDGTVGVDLNRNYGFQWGIDNTGSSPNTNAETYRGTAPFSEPETAALSAFFSSRPIVSAQSVHTYSDLWLHPWGYTASPPPDVALYQTQSVHMTAVNGYDYGTVPSLLYLANGSALDWSYGARGAVSYSVEIGSAAEGGFWPSSNLIVPLAEENRLAFALNAWVAAGCAKTVQTQVTEVSGDGDGAIEPGESGGIVVTVQNIGFATTATPVALSLAAGSADATVLDGAASLGPLASLGTGSNAADPLTFSVSPSAAIGASLPFTLTLTYEGLSDPTPVSVPVGALRGYARDPLEADLGWTVGAPGDNAQTGVWVRVDPNGTSSAAGGGGQPLQPEDDHTPAPGVLCFVTGNASPGAGAGTNDVDGGPTTLLTPVFDLSGAVEPRIAYARWFTDATTVDDSFVVSISGDGGASWTTLETVSGSGLNAWNEVSFRVADFVAPTGQMRLRFVASDSPNNSLYEAAIDDLRVEAFNPGPTLSTFGTPSPGKAVSLGIGGSPGQAYALFFGLPGPPFPIPGIVGNVGLLPAPLILVSSAALPAGSFASVVLGVPNDPSLLGGTVGFQALLAGGAPPPTLTNAVSVTIG